MLDKSIFSKLEGKIDHKIWHLLYSLASNSSGLSSTELLFEAVGKVFISQTDFDTTHWHWVQEDQITPSRNWNFKDKNPAPQLTKLFNNSEKNSVVIPFVTKLKELTTPLILSLSPDFQPFKQVLCIPIQYEGQTKAIMQFFSTQPKINENFSNSDFLQILSYELNRQYGNCLIHEKERDQVVQLAQASRLSSLGAMAGGIAHEINNPVTIIMGMLRMVIKELSSDKPVNREKICSTLEKARQYTERISKIVKGIRALSRDGSRDPFILSKAQDIIDNTFGLCEASIQTNSIQLSYDLEDPDMSLECRPVQISQVLLNLINNSLDAIGDQKSPWIHLAVKKIDDNTAEFSVTDSGNGIPEHIANQLMQPFFTTKGAGKGTGLGLSISQEIIKAHFGEFKLDRDFPNTRFYIRIPIDQNKNEAKAS